MRTIHSLQDETFTHRMSCTVKKEIKRKSTRWRKTKAFSLANNSYIVLFRVSLANNNENSSTFFSSPRIFDCPVRIKTEIKQKPYYSLNKFGVLLKQLERTFFSCSTLQD